MNTNPVVRWKWLFFLLISPLGWSTAFSAEGPQTFTLDGRIKQAGTTTPILDSSVKIEVHVMDPSRQCVIYAEEQFVNTQTSNGYFNIQVGSNTGAGKRIAGVDPGLAMATVFSNAAAMAGTNVSGQTCPLVLGNPTYTPTTKDARYFRIFVTPSSTAVTDTLADVVLDAVPNAMVAENALSAQTVGGVTAANLLQVNTAGGHVLTQSNLDVVFTTSNYSALTALLAGSSTLYNRPASNGTTVIPAIAAPTSPSAGQVWYNAGNILYHDGSTTRTISTGSSSSVSAGAGTAGAPSISFSGDTDTGWYLAAPDNLAAATGGVERVRINENGNLGIGSATPGARLTLGGNMTAPAWTSSGIGIRQNSATYTDSSSSGTVGFNYVNAFGIPTLASSSATTVTDASTFSLYPPVPGTNTTITNSTGLTINASTLTGVTNGYGLQVNAPTGATNNYAATFNGNVGIGTTAPSVPLDISSDTGPTVALRGSAINSGINISRSGGTVAAPTAIGTANTLFNMTVSAHDGTTYNNVADMRVNADGAVDSGLIRFQTRPAAGTITERMRITSIGRVGIGTSSPLGTFDVSGDDGAAPVVYIRNNTSTTVNRFPQIRIENYNGATPATAGVPQLILYSARGTRGTPAAMNINNRIGTIDFNAVNDASGTQVSAANITAHAGENYTSTAGGSYLIFRTTSIGTTTGAERMRIHSNGNVGIGATAPTAALMLKAGTAAAGTAPLKLTAGPVNTTAEAGAIEFDGTSLFYTDSGNVRRTLGVSGTDSFATLLGVCANGFVPHKLAGAWTCLEATDSLVNTSLVKRDGSGNFAAAQGTLNSLRLNNAGSYVSVSTPLTANYALTLPVDDGTPNQVLQTDGSGVLSWATSLVSGGSGLFANGTAAAPSISFTNDSDTGFYNPSNDSNVIATSTNGTEKMRVDASGNIGIGTTAPTGGLELAARVGAGTISSSATTVTGVGTSFLSQVAVGDMITLPSGISERVSAIASDTSLTIGAAFSSPPSGSAFTIDKKVILGSGNIGIGTTAPAAPLHVVSDRYGALQMSTYSSGQESQVLLSRSLGSQASPSFVTTNTNLGSIVFQGHTGSFFTVGADIRATAAEDWSGAGRSANIVFNTKAVGTNSKSEKVRISANGDVAIGTTAPSGRLHISSDSTGSVQPLLIDTYQGSQFAGGSLVFRGARGTTASPTATQVGDRFGIIGARGHDGSAFSAFSNASVAMQATENFTATAKGTMLTFSTTPNTTATAVERMRIDHNGNVGIGTTNPSSSLDIRRDDANASLKLQVNSATAWRAPAIDLNNHGAEFGGYPIITARNARGTSTSPVALSANDPLLVLAGAGQYSTTVGQSRTGADILMFAGGAYSGTSNPGYIYLRTTAVGSTVPVERLAITSSGNVGIGTTVPTATLMLKAGTAAAGTAPLKLTAGPVNTTAEAGAIEFDGTSLFYTDSGNVRRTLGVSGAGITALTGDVTATGSGSVAATIASSAVTTAKIADDNVTFEKLQNIATQTLIGRGTAATGDPEAVTLSAGFTITGGALTLTDTTDDDSFAALLGVCGNGFVPHKLAGAWTCLEATELLVNTSLVKRDGSGNFAAAQGTLNSLRLHNAGSYVSVNSPLTANYALTLPIDDGTPNQILQTDGSGVLTWTSTVAGSGDFKKDGTVDMTGTIKAIAGTAALPGYTFVSDPNTGVYAPAADNVAVTTNGTERIRVTDTGLVGIGTTAPFVRKLDVSDAHSLSNPVTGISRSSIGLINNDTTNDNFSEIGFVTQDLGGTATTGAKIAAVYTSHTTSAVSADLRFVNRSAGTMAERMRIESGGNVGIGTTAPTAKLHVSRSTAAGDVAIRLSNLDNSGTKSLDFGGNSSDGHTDGRIRVHPNSDGDGAHMSFWTETVGAFVPMEKMRILANGNVGIGTSLPTAVLTLKAGTAAAGTAPLKLTSGPVNTTAEAGAIEFDGTNLFYTNSSNARQTLATTASSSFTGVSSISNSGGNITLSPAASSGSVIIDSNVTSTSSSTGSLRVQGGAGVTGDIYAGASLNAGTSLSVGTTGFIPQLYGSASASGNIKIDGTSDATKGNVIVSSAGGDFIVGSVQKADTGTAVGDNRMFYDTTKGAFRAGTAAGTQWDNASVGTGSVALGRSPIATNNGSVAIGNFVMAYGDSSTAFGYDAIASGTQSFAVGLGNASGTNPTVSANGSAGFFFGNNGNATITGTKSMGFFIDQGGINLSQANTFAFMGGKMGVGVLAPSANLMLKAGTAAAGTAPLKLTAGPVNTTAEAGAIEFDGTNLFYTNSSNARQTLATTAGGSFTGVTSIANSGGNITLSPAASSGSVIIDSNVTSTSSSTGSLRVQGGAGVTGDIYAGASLNAGTTLSVGTNGFIPQIYGGAAASGNIKIDGTSHATPGYVLMATGSGGGRVGIGTTVPVSPLTVYGTGGSLVPVTVQASNISNYSQVEFTDAAGTAQGGIGHANSSTSFIPSSMFFGAKNTTEAVHIIAGLAAPTPRLTVLPSGNVGIGTTAPAFPFHVSHAGDNGQALTVGDMTTLASITGLYFRSSTEGRISTATSAAMTFYTSSGSSTEKMRIAAGGNVGIGTTNPAQKLDVTGGSIISGAAVASGAGSPALRVRANAVNSTINRPVAIKVDADSDIRLFADSGTYDNVGMYYRNTDDTMHFTSGITTPTIENWTEYNSAGSAVTSYSKWRVNLTTGEMVVAGNVGIGAAPSAEKLEVSGNVKATNFISTSDARLKRDVAAVSGLDAIMKLNGVSWNWIDSGKADMGVIAQDVEKVFPQSVVTDASTGYKAVKYNSLVAPLIESTKELYGLCLASEKRNDSQDRMIASLKIQADTANRKVQKLEKENADMKARLDRIERLLIKK